MLLESSEDTEHRLPFYADGYPGVVYAKTTQRIQLLPYRKELSTFFLYGQTINPIELSIQGKYKLIIFRLYPFATRLLLNINPAQINDDCYELEPIKEADTHSLIVRLKLSRTDRQIRLISAYILDLVKNSAVDPDNAVKMAVSTLVNLKGDISIRQLRQRLYITERTFERRFKKEIGVSPKQFAKIVQFSFSLNQIRERDYVSLTTIAYQNGFADQSHFIRTFKRYTGSTPSEMLSELK